MNRKLLFFLFAFFCSPAFSATNYVTDEFEVMLRTGPSVQNKIIAALPSGTRLEVLRKDAGNAHSQVQASSGEIGYVLTRFLSDQPAAKSRLATLEAQLKQLQSQPNELRSLLVKAQNDNKRLSEENREYQDSFNKTKADYDRLRVISKDSANLADENQRLNSEVQQLLLQLDDIRIQNESLKDNSERKWFMLGAFAVGIGLFLGWILSFAKRRRRNVSSW
jgi:SH3 domain protein